MPELPPLPRPRPAAALLDPSIALRSHYLEMPGLNLTAAQARRLCGLMDVDLASCERLLEGLVTEHFLARAADGRYYRAA